MCSEATGCGSGTIIQQVKQSSGPYASKKAGISRLRSAHKLLYFFFLQLAAVTRVRKANKMEVKIMAMWALLPEAGKAGEKLWVFLPSRQHGGGLWSMFTGGGRKAIFVFM